MEGQTVINTTNTPQHRTSLQQHFTSPETHWLNTSPLQTFTSKVLHPSALHHESLGSAACPGAEAESEKGGVRGWSSALEPPLLLHLRQSSIQSTRQPVTSDLKFGRIFARVKRVQRHDLLIVSPSGRWTVDSSVLGYKRHGYVRGLKYRKPAGDKEKKHSDKKCGPDDMTEETETERKEPRDEGKGRNMSQEPRTNIYRDMM
ncbi:hypothetical protein Pcinc_041775 [Petrolisthes cinctipes]|uniref:Uncharacterized protein n=1 Tax=Petrolisthes cinctipes TaxID=88211 RepID=A0AAE1EGM8_PETCI|nr:hypothetical protein Pcinc_041775 [Petrolisthes cinctipes]